MACFAVRIALVDREAFEFAITAQSELAFERIKFIKYSNKKKRHEIHRFRRWKVERKDQERDRHIRSKKSVVCDMSSSRAQDRRD